MAKIKVKIRLLKDGEKAPEGSTRVKVRLVRKKKNNEREKFFNRMQTNPNGRRARGGKFA